MYYQQYDCRPHNKYCPWHCPQYCCPAPKGPSIGTIVPYSTAYLYLASDDPEVYTDNEFFVMPVDGTLDRLVLSFELFDYFIGPLTTGTLEYRVFTFPLAANIPTLVASGQFTPAVTSATPIGTFLVADQVLNVPVPATTRIAIALKYSSSTPILSTLNGTLYGGLHIV